MQQPDDVDALLRQAQQLIIKNAPGAAQQFSAVLAQSKPGSLSNAQRVRLGFSTGLALFASPVQSAAVLQHALSVLQDALVLADTLPVPAVRPVDKGVFDSVKALHLLNRTLASLAARDCVAFAFGGALLGLIRDGCLLPFDKDLDIVVPLPYFTKVCDLLKADGWQRCWVPVRAENFVCFLDAASGITLDVFAYAFDEKQARISGGWWPHGLEREQGRLLAFSPFKLTLSSQHDGRFWRIQQPEQVLAELYGEGWRIPDPAFDASLETPALVSWTDYVHVWASLKLLEAWTLGRTNRMAGIIKVLHAQDHNNPLCQLFKSVQASAKS